MKFKQELVEFPLGLNKYKVLRDYSKNQPYQTKLFLLEKKSQN